MFKYQKHKGLYFTGKFSDLIIRLSEIQDKSISLYDYINKQINPRLN